MPLSPRAARAVLVAPAPFGGDLRAPVVAAAIGRGLEAAGLRPPDPCPLAGGGAGTVGGVAAPLGGGRGEVLRPARGGETADGFALVEDGGTALVEPSDEPEQTAERLRAAAAAGPAGMAPATADAGREHAAAALARAGNLGGARTVVLAAPGDAAELPAGANAV